MNKEKTTALYIGKSKKKTPAFNDISWTKTHVKTLGVCHGYQIDNNAIWLDKINKIKSCLRVWKSNIYRKNSYIKNVCSFKNKL